MIKMSIVHSFQIIHLNPTSLGQQSSSELIVQDVGDAVSKTHLKKINIIFFWKNIRIVIPVDAGVVTELLVPNVLDGNLEGWI